MATNSEQILNITELKAKLGTKTNTTPKNPNCGEIKNIWDTEVYLLEESPTNMLVNNGEVWPQKYVKYSNTTLRNTYFYGTRTYVNFRNANWEIGTTYAIDTNCKAYVNDSYASSGYYMDDSNYWVSVTSNGTIDNTGTYTPPNITPSSTIIKLGIDYGDTVTFTITTTEQWRITLNDYQYDFINNATVNNEESAEIISVSSSSGTGNATITVTRIAQNSAKRRAAAIKITSTVDSSLYAYVMVIPDCNLTKLLPTTSGNTPEWNPTCDAQSITAINYTYYSVTWTKSSSLSWINGSGATLTVDTNTGSARPATVVTMTATCSIPEFTAFGIYHGVESESVSIKVKQMAKRTAVSLYVVMKKSSPNTIYLSKSRTSVTSSNLVELPSGYTVMVDNINIIGTIRLTSNSQTMQVELDGSGSFSSSSTGEVDWLTEDASGTFTVTKADVVNVNGDRWIEDDNGVVNTIITDTNEYSLNSTYNYIVWIS